MAATSTRCTRAARALIVTLLALPDIATFFHLKGNISDTPRCRCGNAVDSFPSFSSLPRARERVCESLSWCLEFPRSLRNAFSKRGGKRRPCTLFFISFFFSPSRFFCHTTEVGIFNRLFCQARWRVRACSFTLITPKAGLFTGL